MSWPWTLLCTLLMAWYIYEICWAALRPAEVAWRLSYGGWLSCYLLGAAVWVQAVMWWVVIVGAFLLLVCGPLVRARRFLSEALSGDPVPACAVVDCWAEGQWTEEDGTPRCMAHVGRPTP